MSLTTVTLALDDKLRSLRNSSFDSDKDLDLDTSIDSTIINHQPLTLGENIPFADESPERPLIQSRSKPVRVSTYSIPTSRYTARLYSHGSTSPNSPQDALSSSQSHSSQENVKVGTTSSDDTDASTTSNPMETFPSSVRIDRDMIREMNRILTTLERKATKLNRSLSLNYKNHKGECCCNNNTNNNYRQGNRLPLTKDEKTDKNINKKRQIQDGKSRRYTNRSIKRRHTVGGTHDYDVNKSGQNVRCRQGHQMGGEQMGQRASSPDLLKDNHVDKVICVNES